jgi:uncharacterized protein YndB with AHSA1/START domain
MSANNETVYTKDVAKKQMTVVRKFDAPIEQVWKAWTESSLLDQWWAPKPWKARTKSMDFRPGGKWIYAMVGPEGEQHFARMDYETITPQKGYTSEDSFCDENGVKNEEMPSMHWNTQFASTGSGTTVTVLITFSSEEAMDKLVEMGFKEGFAMAHSNLDELLQNQSVKK